MELSRRSFIQGAFASGVAAVAAGGVVGCGSSSTPSGDPTSSAATTGVHSWDVKPDSILDAEIVETVEADVVIVGSGFAGVCAAQSAAEEGATVVVIERTDQPQGRGLDIGTVGNKYQKAAGLDRYLDKQSLSEILAAWSCNKTNRSLVRVWLNRSAEAFEHLAAFMESEHGIAPVASVTASTSNYTASDINLRELPTPMKFGEGWFDADGNWIMVGVVNKVAQWAKDLGAEFRFNTTAEQLIREGEGPVTGVVASTSAGYVKFTAKKAVILATGDIGGNVEMLEAWAPLALRVDANVYTPAGMNTGDGLKMGLWIGAGLQKGFPAAMIHPLAVKGAGLFATESFFPSVNTNGERFYNERANVPGISNARLCQPGSSAWTIFDGDYQNKTLQVRPDNISIVGGQPLVSERTTATVEEELAKDNGTFFRADTLEELAGLIGADPAGLTASIDRYNELCKLGVDEDFYKPGALMTTVDTPPYYASWLNATALTIIYGLNCDAHSRVCDSSDQPIENLYAIGNVQGNFFADDYPFIAPGISHGRSLTFGHLLPKAILRGELLTDRA